MKDAIAIVGIGGVFPGANDLDEFWQNILEGKDCAIDVQADRWTLEPDELYSESLSADKVNSRRACLIQDFQFDANGFAIDTDFLQSLDLMYQILLHAGRDAWHDSSTEKIDKNKVGIIIGNIVLPTEKSSQLSDEVFSSLFESKLFDQPFLHPQTNPVNRYAAGLPAGLLAKAMGFGANCYTLDAACASSLYALKYAVDELRAKRADAMLAGGLSRPDCLYTQMGFSQLQAISKSGRCSPFDNKADGLVVGEGSGIVVLKRLGDALEQGDYIYATIEGIGLSNDIEGSLMSPDSNGQLRAMKAAYAQANWQASDVQHIECHGTGTPIGDGVEFDSLNNLWSSEDKSKSCVIGSVKSNVGHLLTAAGSAALIKTLMAMKQEKLPATANFEKSSNNIDLENSPFNVLSKSEEWLTENNEPRRAAISGFGFGGINAHVLLQEYKSPVKQNSPVVKKDNIEQCDIAIIGMDAHVGPWNDLESFNQHVIYGDEFKPRQPENWWGADSKEVKGFLIDKVDVPLGRYRIPPAELKEMLPQQLLMLEVAANALDDAGLANMDETQRHRAGVFIGIGLDLNTTNFHFRWMMPRFVRAWLKKQNLDLDDASIEKWIAQLREASGPALTANRTMGALGGIVASRIARAFKIGGPSFTLSSEETSGMHALGSGMRALQGNELDQVIVGAVDLAADLRAVMGHVEQRQIESLGEGASAFILKRHEDAIRDGDHVYALIKGIANTTGGACDQPAPDKESWRSSIELATKNTGCELSSIDYIECHRSGDEKEDKIEEEVFNQLRLKSDLARNTIKSITGHTGAASGLTAVSRAALAIQQRLLPPTEQAETRHWLQDRIDGPRRALINSISIAGNCSSVILEEAGSVSTHALNNKNKIFALSAKTKDELLEQLRLLKFEDVIADSNNEIRVVLLVSDEVQLQQAISNVINAIENNQSINNGQCFYSIEPLAREGKLAFVYPGSGNHFHGMGRELGVCFPQVLEKLNAENDSLRSQFAKGRFWNGEEAKALTHEEVIFGQVWLGTFISDVVSSFAIKPDAVIGYSLGETAGFFSTRTWQARDEMLRRIQDTTLFTEDLAGPCTSVQKTWGVDGDVDWALGVINSDATSVEKVISYYEKVYLLIINTPDECVIGGDRKQLQQAVQQLDSHFHPITGVTTVHCEVAKPVEKPYRDLHLFETTPPEGVTFYSGIRGGAYEVTRESAADSILDQALQSFDYTKVINSAYDDGVRLFIEMGPGATCTRMIDRILEDKPHYAKAICTKGKDSVLNLLQTLASLYTEGVDVDFSQIQYLAEKEKIQNKNVISVITGGKPFDVPPPPQSKESEIEPDNVVEFPEAKEQMVSEQPAELVNAVAVNDSFTPIIQQMQATEIARAEAQEMFLKLNEGITQSLTQALNMQMSLLSGSDITSFQHQPVNPAVPNKDDVLFDRGQCMEIATGLIGNVLGEKFKDIDSHPTRVRLPDEPLMLVDRIIEIEGEADSMTSGRIVTEHDVLQGAWYLDNNRIPTCVAVEAGQADLFLSGYLGIDHITKGLAVYRLLDAKITFYDALPTPGDVIHYDIHIDHFFRQGDTWLFRFNFEGTVNGKPLLTMTDGCAGFFTQQELDAGQGIVLTSIEKQSQNGIVADDWSTLVDMQVESYSEHQLNALRQGQLSECFGSAFADLPLKNPVGLPGERMTLVHRILKLDPGGGRFGIGQIVGEADIHPDDWFLTCHFVDDKVMPGTLMYECCLHTLRVYLLRMGWVGEADEIVYEPVPNITSQLKCRGQVLDTTQKVQYEITLKEIGYQDNDTPYVLADALMYGDGKAIVQMHNMSVQLSGLTRDRVVSLWSHTKQKESAERKVLFDFDSIYAFAAGKPSDAFGDRYLIFDEERKIARLPRPPYQFLDRITHIEQCEQWVLKAGGIIEAEYDVPEDAWYFASDRQAFMPFAVLLEVALQPCGWLAAYLGSALTSDIDLSFRNLGGKATQYAEVTPVTGTLTTRVKITNVSQSGGMIIQNYDYEMRSNEQLIYKGDTYFGFFSKEALADQIGIREIEKYAPTEEETSRAESFRYPEASPYPDDMMRMVDEVAQYDPDGGPDGLGYIKGLARVNPDNWFFKAHFYQDPVWPGSLGLESFMQLLKVVAWRRWGEHTEQAHFESMALGQRHEWIYRGQIIPQDEQVTVEAVVKSIDDEQKILFADGFLTVDGRIIYQMNDFAIKLSP